MVSVGHGGCREWWVKGLVGVEHGGCRAMWV